MVARLPPLPLLLALLTLLTLLLSLTAYYFKPDVVKMNDTILALGGNHVKLQEFVTKRERIVTASQTDGAALLQWERSSDRDRRDTVRISKDVRRQA